MLYEEDSHLTYQHRASASSNCVRESISSLSDRWARGLSPKRRLPEISSDRRQLSLLEDNGSAESVLYLAYGSNLCNETFRGKRGIKPLSQTNVQIPELRLTFDLPGIAYSEPCFANTALRDAEKDVFTQLSTKDTGRSIKEDYHKDRWHKGLIGVVYEVTPTDYAHIIATEGGGSSYHDVLVDCYPFATADPSAPVPQFPTTEPFKAHTLFAPATKPGERPPKDGGRLQRPDTAYAQPSARYLKLITDGAAECRLPLEYQDYLHDLRPYTTTTNKQRLGQFIFLSIWLPFVMSVFAMERVFADDRGVAPEWLRVLVGALFQASWASYDGYFKPMFGDGERTVPKKKVRARAVVKAESKKQVLVDSRLDQCEKGLLEI